MLLSPAVRFRQPPVAAEGLGQRRVAIRGQSAPRWHRTRPRLAARWPVDLATRIQLSGPMRVARKRWVQTPEASASAMRRVIQARRASLERKVLANAPGSLSES